MIRLTESDRVVVRYMGFEPAEMNYPRIADDNWIIMKEIFKNELI